MGTTFRSLRRYLFKLLVEPLVGNRIAAFKRRIEYLERGLEFVNNRLDVSDELKSEFQTARNTPAYRRPYTASSPLVTVCIGTYNRADLLVERSLASVLAQSHKNLEVIVVGDRCTDHTEAAMAKVRDSRVTFVNLPERGRYPEDPTLRWMVAGTTPVNHALTLAGGDFITHLDDDDKFHPERVERLLQAIRESGADLVWHPFWFERAQGDWVLNEARAFVIRQVTTSSIFYHHWFRRIPWDIQAFRYLEPGDWNRLRKIKYLDAKLARYEEPLLWHYLEKQNKI